MEDRLVEVDHVEGVVGVRQALKDVSGGEFQVGILGRGVQGACMFNDGITKVDAGDVAMGEVRAEAGGYGTRAAADVEEREVGT